MSYSVVTTVLASAASYNLVALATVKTELAIPASDTTRDTWLSSIAIPQVSASIARYCKRPFVPEFVQDQITIFRSRSQVPGGVWTVQLSRWPVLMITSLAQLSTDLGTTVTLVENTDFRVDYENGELQRLNSDTGQVTAWEALPLTVQYVAGSGAIVAETNTVPASPYQITVAQAATFSCAAIVAYANGTPLTAVKANPATGQYSVNAGQYTFAVGDTGKPLNFTYATVAIDNDLVGIVLRLITARFTARGRDPTLMQVETPNIGIQRYWVGGGGTAGQFPPDIEDALNCFRVSTAS